MKARIIIGANYGDEGKGTVVANYTKKSTNVINILTNGGAQRAHSILTKDGNITFQHFGSGTYHGADNYYSCYFIINPMLFVKEYSDLIVKPKVIYRDRRCRWSTPFDSMSNLIVEHIKGTHDSCCMGIWNTIKRCNSTPICLFDDFIKSENKEKYLEDVKRYYESFLDIPSYWKKTWNSPYLIKHFIEDCEFLYNNTQVKDLKELKYENLIFENGQGLLLCDTGKDTPDTTPSNTGISYALSMCRELGIEDVTAHYVTRPYLTRHGDGHLNEEINRKYISKYIEEDRTNHYNDNQGEFRYGILNVDSLLERIKNDSQDTKYELEVTHCDEMDLTEEFKKKFDCVNCYDTPLV